MRFLVIFAVVAGMIVALGGAAHAQVFRPRARTPATIAKANATLGAAAAAKKPVIADAPAAATKKPVHAVQTTPGKRKPMHTRPSSEDDSVEIVDDDEDAKPAKKKPAKKKPAKDPDVTITDD
jgi:hypothetical protein